MSVNLSAIDLNLFLVLHVVLEERSATRAARRLHVTQSAVSNALARLRQLLGDPLVVRNGRGLAPTPRATELQPLLREVTARLELAIDRRGFVPEQSTRTFTMALADNHQACDAPAVAAAFATHLPRASLRMVSADYLLASDGLASGDVDIALVPEQAVAPGQRSLFLFDEYGALVVRRDHPQVRRRFTRELFNTSRHVDVQVALGRPGVGHRAAEQQWLAQRLRRQVVLTVPYFMTAAMVAAHTDCVAALPDRLARLACQLLPLKIVPASFPLPRLKIVMVWHERTNADAGALYFRQLVSKTVRHTSSRRHLRQGTAASRLSHGASRARTSVAASHLSSSR